MTGAPAGRYARWELERRFLCSRIPETVSDENGWDVVDRYLPDSRLRLRRMDALDGSETIFKLGKKEVPEPRDFARMTITTIYLSADEYEQLAALPANVLHKRRYRIEEGRRLWSVDVFDNGLVLAETDVETDSEQFELPDWIECDVSDDERYTGGALAENKECGRD